MYAGVDVRKGELLLCSLLGFAKGFKALFSGCIEREVLMCLQEVHRKLDDISRKSYDDETFDDDVGDGDDDDDGGGDGGGDGDGDGDGDGAHDDESDRYSSDSVDIESLPATSTRPAPSPPPPNDLYGTGIQYSFSDCHTLLGCAVCGDITRATEMMNDQPASFAIEIDQRNSQVCHKN